MAFLLKPRVPQPGDPDFDPKAPSDDENSPDAAKLARAQATGAADNIPPLAPAPSRPLSSDADRPQLEFNKRGTADGTASATAPATAPAPAADPYDADKAELAIRSKPDAQNAYLKPHPSRLKAALLTMLAGAGDAANRAMESGSKDPLAMALGGAAGGAAGGAINPMYPQQQKNAARKAELEKNIGFELQRRKTESDIEQQNSENELRDAQAKNLPDKTKGELLDKAQARILEEYRIAGQYTPGENKDFDDRAAAAGLHLTPYGKDDKPPTTFEQEDEQGNKRRYEYVKGKDGQYHGRLVTDETGKPLPASAAKEKDLKIPETFYRGRDQGRIKEDATAEVLSKDAYYKEGVRPEVLQAFGGDMDKIQRGIQDGTVKPNEIFSDPAKGTMFQRDLAATYSRKANDAQMWDRAIDMTSKSPGAARKTYGEFEQAYKAFQSKFKAAKTDAARADLTRRFQQELGRVRLVGDE